MRTAAYAGCRVGGVSGLGRLGQSVFAQDEQIVVAPTGPAPGSFHKAKRVGPIRRAFRRTSSAIHEHFIGNPEEFVEPPLGFYVYENIGMMKAKADPHRFTLYNSDFLVGSDRLSPAGARRFSEMARGLPKWMGPMIVEWTPENPALATARKDAVVALLDSARIPIVPERVVVGPSQYEGLFGTDAGNNYTIMINRDIRAGMGFSVSPATTATFSGGGQR